MAATPPGTVVLLPGILGSELYENHEQIWISIWNLIRGDLAQLQLDANGRSLKAIQASTPLKDYYGEMQLALLQQWNVVTFAYDWRLDIRALARQLKEKIDTSVPATSGFSLVAHSLGGLIGRSYLQQFPEDLKRLQKFIMLGTPNYGMLAIPVLYNGLNDVLKIVALLDQQHYLPDLLQFAKTWVSTYQMLPFPGKSADAARLMDPAVYGDLHPLPQRFDAARAFQQELNGTDTARMTYIAGYGFKTPDAIADWTKLKSWDGYHHTLAGDGLVPHSLGLLDKVTTYFVQAQHNSLPADARVIQAVLDILATGASALPTHMPQIDMLTQPMLAAEIVTECTARETRAHILREIVRMERLAHPDKVSVSETELRNLIFTGTRQMARATGAGN
jgi:pimeloyl-ACP methyl ester carboxylesterase